jgi:hypothetical protein
MCDGVPAVHSSRIDPSPTEAYAFFGHLLSDVAGTWRRIGFLARCALLEDFAYGLPSGAESYLEKSLRGME